MPDALRRLMLAALRPALAKLEEEAAAGLLSAADRRFLAAVTAFRLGWGRSGQDGGVFIVGLADARASRDATYWSAALVHDGVHALLQRRGRPYFDERAPCQAQMDYLQRTGAPDCAVEHVARFRDAVVLQRRRYREPG